MTVKELKTKIFPVPKQAQTNGEMLQLKSCRIDVQTDVITAETAAELMKKALTEQGVAVCEDAETVITLSLGEAPEGVINKDSAYAVEVTENAVNLTGFGEAGLYYTAVTLSQILKNGEVPVCTVLDWPDMANRGHFIECRYFSDIMQKQDWMDAIDDAAMRKCNAITLDIYNCWVVQYDRKVSEFLYIPIEGHPELQTTAISKYYSPKLGHWVRDEQVHPIVKEDFLGELMAYGRKRGVEVNVAFSSYGHNTLIPRKNANVSAKDESGEPTLSGFCTSNPETYELLFSIYDYIIDKYLKPNGVTTFGAGLDEVWAEVGQNPDDIFKLTSPWCQCPECRKHSKGELFVNHAVRCIKYLKEKGMKNVIMACDMLIDHGPNGVGELSQMLLDKIRENDLMDVVSINWWTYADLPEKLMFRTTRPELGFRRSVVPWNGYYAWCMQCNSVRDVYMLAEMGIREKCEGYTAYSTWDSCFDRTNHLIAEFPWNLEGSGGIEGATDHYLKINFPTKFEQARRAFQIADYITEERIDQPEGNSSCLANYFMLRDRLSYYFYTYVETGKPYPHPFPGEALEKICKRRDDHVRAMLQISSMAKELADIWEEIAADPACNQLQARRYVYEAHNYMVLVDDFLALLRMMELTEAGEYEAIRQLALARKEARLEQMRELEEVKAAYLAPFQLRNSSVYMQFFADLADYIEKTPVDEIKLDWYDMRYLESDRSRWLR